MATTFSHMPTPIPCLPRWPLLGNVFALRNKRLDLLLRISQQFGDIGAFHFGPRMVPVLNEPELIRQVLVEQGSSFEKTTTVRALGTPVLGNGVFLSEGEEHRQQRRILAPLFQPHHVQTYAETMIGYTLRMRERWKEGETLNLADEMTHLTLWIISDVLFGVDVSGEEQELGAALTYLFRHFAAAVTNPMRLPQSWPTPGNRRARQALHRVNTTLYQMINERRQSNKERGDFLSTILRAHEGQISLVSDQQIRDEALSLFVAGHETTANALTWCWYLLSQHPGIYEQMQAEGDRVLAGRPPTLADLPHLPYTLQVLKETLRLYPPVYAFTRRAISTVQLGKYLIPEGASVVISPYTLHRRAPFFSQPERFYPARFALQQEQQIPRYAYLPFGAGSHICLGMHFALLEGHLLLATIAQHCTFEFIGSQSIEPEPLLTLRPKGAVLMKVRRR